MKKTILLIFICLLGISNISAQFSTIPYTGSNSQLRTAQADIFKFGYSSDIEDWLGTGSSVATSAAILMPAARYGAYAGKTITTISVGVGQASTNVSVWIRSELNGPNLAEKELGSAAADWREVVLDTPFTIPEGDIFIGYTATATHPIGYSLETPEAGLCWISAPNIPWMDVQAYGIPAIQAYIDLSGDPVLDMGIDKLKKSQAVINENSSTNAVLHNVSPEETITTLKYAYSLNEQEAIEKTIVTNIAPNSVASIDLPIDPIASAGTYSIKITILELNGQADAFLANNSATNSHTVALQLYPKKVIVEQGTGAWCRFCPRGKVGMAMMEEKYPESFIGIAVHNGDGMAVSSYSNFMVSNFFSGYPTSVVNRKSDLVGDPYYDIENFYLSEMATEALASVELTGGYTGTNNRNINLTTTVTFGFPEESSNYRLSYVLKEHGITGYTQENAYAGGHLGPMGGYEHKPAEITDQVYDDVARGIYTTAGIANSIPQSITEFEPITHEYTITVPSTIKNKNQVELIVMLLDKDGEVVNANRIKLEEKEETDIPSVSKDDVLLSNIHKSKEVLTFTINANDAVTIGLYDISGRLISSEVKSINGVEAITLPTNGLNGVYLLKAQTKDKVSTKKVVL